MLICLGSNKLCLSSEFWVSLLSMYSWNKYIICNMTSTPQMVRLSMIDWKSWPLPGLDCSCVFLTSAFILQTYHLCHKEVLLTNYSDSDSDIPHLTFPFILIIYKTKISSYKRISYFCLIHSSVINMIPSFCTPLGPSYI